MARDLTEAPPPPATRSLVNAAEALAVAPHVLAGVKGLKGWDDLFPVTDDQLRAAVIDFNSIKLG